MGPMGVPAMDLVIRRQQPDDRASVRGLIVAAFGDAVVADLAEALLAASTRGADGLSWVATVDGQIVGHVQLSRSWLDAPRRLVDVLVLSPLGVLPSFQRRGIGGRLIRHAIAEAEAQGAPALFLEGDPRHYAPHGFEPAGKYGFTAPSVRIPDRAFQVVLLPSHESWMTGALVYAEPFWIHDRVGLRDPNA